MPGQRPHSHYVWWLVGLIAFVGVAYAFEITFFNASSQPVSPSTYGSFPKSAPAPTPHDYVTAQKGFQYLVSYTDNGFQPKTLSVKKGETVRFTNNSATTLQLSLAGATPLAHGAYFEYTFTKAGTFTVTDGSINTIQVTVK